MSCFATRVARDGACLDREGGSSSSISAPKRRACNRGGSRGLPGSRFELRSKEASSSRKLVPVYSRAERQAVVYLSNLLAGPKATGRASLRKGKQERPFPYFQHSTLLFSCKGQSLRWLRNSVQLVANFTETCAAEPGLHRQQGELRGRQSSSAKATFPNEQSLSPTSPYCRLCRQE